MYKSRVHYTKCYGVFGHGSSKGWRCSLLIVTKPVKSCGVAHLVGQGWGLTKRQALEYAMIEAHDFFILSKFAGEKEIKRLDRSSKRK